MDIPALMALVNARYGWDFVLKREQTEVIQMVLEKQNVIAILPTGFGKSMMYLLPPLLLDEVGCALIMKATTATEVQTNPERNVLRSFARRSFPAPPSLPPFPSPSSLPFPPLPLPGRGKKISPWRPVSPTTCIRHWRGNASVTSRIIYFL